MADLTKLSDQDLKALYSGDLTQVSDEGLKYLHSQQPGAPKEEPGKLESFIRGGSSGLSLGLIPNVITPAVEAAGSKMMGDQSDLEQLYKKYQEASQTAQEQAKQAHPIMYGAGAVAGAAAPILLSAGAAAPEVGLAEAAELGGGALAKEVGKRALTGAATGAAMGGIAAGTESKGQIIGGTTESANQLVNDIKKGMTSGATIGGALSMVSSGMGIGINQLADQLENSSIPFLRQVAKSYKMGQKGTNLGSEKERIFGSGDKAPLIQQDASESRDIMTKIMNADKDLGQRVGQSLEKATQEGRVVDISDPLRQSAKSLDEYFQKNPAIDIDPTAQKNFLKILSKEQQLKPLEAKSALDETDNMLRQLQGDPSTLANASRQVIGNFRKALSQQIKDSIPGYADAANRFEEFRSLIPETIISKATPSDLSNVYFGSLKNKEGSLFEGIKDLVQGATKPGDVQSQEAFANLSQNLNKLDQSEQARLAQGKIDDTVFQKMGIQKPKDLVDKIKNTSDESQVRQTVFGAPPTPPGGKLTTTAARNIIGYGKAEIFKGANKLGKYSAAGATPEKLGPNVYNMGDEQLSQMAGTISSLPGLKSVADSLSKGIADKNQSMKNAALFSLMQNPNAREAIYSYLGGDSTKEPEGVK